MSTLSLKIPLHQFCTRGNTCTITKAEQKAKELRCFRNTDVAVTSRDLDLARPEDEFASNDRGAWRSPPAELHPSSCWLVLFLLGIHPSSCRAFIPLPLRHSFFVFLGIHSSCLAFIPRPVEHSSSCLSFGNIIDIQTNVFIHLL